MPGKVRSRFDGQALRPEQCRNTCPLIKADFEDRGAARREQRRQLRCDAAVIVEAFIPRKQRGMGFMVQHIARE